jgi:hypothetical protein
MLVLDAYDYLSSIVTLIYAPVVLDVQGPCIYITWSANSQLESPLVNLHPMSFQIAELTL